MERAGIMDQVRGLLSQGLKSAEIIAQGYAPSTVYGVQRNFRKKQGLGTSFPTTGLNTQGYQARLASENRWLRRRVEALEDPVAETSEDGDGPSSLQRLEDVEKASEQLLAQVARTMKQWRSWSDRIDGELDDLALLYKDDVLFGIGKPKWQRRRIGNAEEGAPRSLGSGSS